MRVGFWARRTPSLRATAPQAVRCPKAGTPHISVDRVRLARRGGRAAYAGGHMLVLPTRRALLPIICFCGVAVVAGVVAARNPFAALAMLGVPAIAALPFVVPTASFVLLLGLLAIVPYGIQNQLGVGGGTGAVGLVLSDVLFSTLLAWALLCLLQRRLDRLRLLAIAGTFAVLAAVAVQFYNGAMVHGHSLSDAGVEMRTLAGLATGIIAIPLLDDPVRRRRLLRGLLGLGLLLGAWGLAQWLFGISYGESGDFGVRSGVRLTSDGRGQLLGGLYGFPVVVVMGAAVLFSGQVRDPVARGLLLTAVALNLICLLLTYERTFWLTTVIGAVWVLMRSGMGATARAVLLGPILALALTIPLAMLSPGTLTTAQERLLSLGQYGSDGSVSYRVIETRHVLQEIAERPFGSGLGATIYWGRPASNVPPENFTYVHNGYLMLAWKLGIIPALILTTALLLAALRRKLPRHPALLGATVIGAQGALLALLIGNVTFKVITTMSATGLIGLLVAFVLLPPDRLERSPTRG